MHLVVTFRPIGRQIGSWRLTAQGYARPTDYDCEIPFAPASAGNVAVAYEAGILN